MPGWPGSASSCCVTLVESLALSGPLSLPIQESCHTTPSFTDFLPGLAARPFLDTERRNRAAPVLDVEAGDRWHVVVGVEREMSEWDAGVAVGGQFWVGEAAQGQAWLTEGCSLRR